ncbi:MAG: hypothetical protein HGA61_03015 [Candidatus Moranbacteria bacterium]|nr:hypothetical protein [Candidatus Moranbacteria bacterium]
MEDETKRKNDLAILFHFHKDQKQELMFRRAREFKIFSWSSGIFVALMAGLLLVIEKKIETNTVFQFGMGEKFFLSSAILLMAVVSISWQNRERKFGNQNSRVLTDINKLLHCFDSAYFGLVDENDVPKTLLLKKWEKWGGKESLLSVKRYFRGNLVTITWVLGFFDIIIVCFLL